MESTFARRDVFVSTVPQSLPYEVLDALSCAGISLRYLRPGQVWSILGTKCIYLSNGHFAALDGSDVYENVNVNIPRFGALFLHGSVEDYIRELAEEEYELLIQEGRGCR
jgi:hypothetical protein